MAAEFFDEARKLRENLQRHADDALYVHQNNPIPDAAEALELRETLMKSVMKMMEMEGDVEKNEKIYSDITTKVKDSGELPTDDEMRKMWEDAEAEMKEFKGTNRKHFKDVIKTIRDEKNDEDADEMEVMQVQHSRKDPISKKDIANPVINESCGHVYDRDSVIEFAGKKKTIKCAMQGCSETITISKLVDYPDYWKNIKPQQ